MGPSQPKNSPQGHRQADCVGSLNYTILVMCWGKKKVGDMVKEPWPWPVKESHGGAKAIMRRLDILAWRALKAVKDWESKFIWKMLSGSTKKEVTVGYREGSKANQGWLLCRSPLWKTGGQLYWDLPGKLRVQEAVAVYPPIPIPHRLGITSRY